jgi:glycosyltransferase involved in cell wall biosynthesis
MRCGIPPQDKSKRMGRVLIVAHDFPFPPNYGGRVDMWSRIKLLHRMGVQVDVVASLKDLPSEQQAQEVQRYVRSLTLVKRDMGLMKLLSREPFSARSRRSLRNIPLSESYSAVILESEHVAAILQNPTLRADKRILRLHNDEAHYYRELSGSSRELWRKAFYRIEGFKFRSYSPRAMQQCDLFWFASDFERQEHCVKYPVSATKAFFVPLHVERSSMKRHKLSGHRVFFAGKLGFANNSRGVEWYIDQVHPRLADIDGYELMVAGNTEGESLDPLRKAIAGHPNISLYESPSELQPYYEMASVFINPVFHGAGVKLKTIDAIRAGLPVVSTFSGIQGTPLLDGKHVLVADNPEAFAGSIRRLFSDRGYAENLVSEAQAFVGHEYDQERIIKGIFNEPPVRSDTPQP